MPFLIRVETETGSAIEEGSDTQNVLTELADRSPCNEGLALVSMIDPWGNTVFNRLQIPILLRDINNLLSVANPEEREVLNSVATLAHRALGEPHLYLKIYGD